MTTKKKKLKLRRWVYVVFILLFLGITVYGGIHIYFWYRDGQDVKEINDNLDNSDVSREKPASEDAENINPPEDPSNDYWDYIKMDMLSVDFNELLQKNPDTVAWVKVNGTNINYPVVQTSDNEYYLNHSYQKKKNSAGWIFGDYRNDFSNFSYNTIIYGHGRLDTTMFGSLKNILNSDWYSDKDNYVVKLSTPTENTLWQVFSVYTIEAESYYIRTEFNSSSEFLDFITTLKSRSQVEFSASVNESDKILTLSTCQDNYGRRVVMHAKLIKRDYR